MIKKIFIYFLVFLLASVSLLSVLGYFGHNHWVLDAFSHFKWQYLVFLSIGTLILFPINKRVAFMILPFILLLIAEVAPIYVGGNKNPELTDTVKIAGINLLTSNNQFEDVETYIQENSPDIIVLQELNDLWELMLEPVLSDYEYRLSIPREDNFGIAVFSKTEFSDLRELTIGEAGVPSISGDFLIGDSTITLIATHPLPPVGSSYFNHRNLQLSELGRMVSEINNEVVVVGDLNTSSFSTHYKKLIKESGLIDSRKGFGLLTTWPTWFSLARITLDHCLVSEGILVKSREVGGHIGSDHLPIVIKIGMN
ncbi:MAG: endonuclease/exonuclease/phosphatase family protein [Cyanothece sp. SIO1E1]|nr:endonuclease/exonuclease/phosphatase family protein [Cyanothece sp. SIO1E1]